MGSVGVLMWASAAAWEAGGMTTNGAPGPRPGHRSRFTGSATAVPAPRHVPIVIRSSRAFSGMEPEDRVRCVVVNEQTVTRRGARRVDSAATVRAVPGWVA
jgi:hypothetical protein